MCIGTVKQVHNMPSGTLHQRHMVPSCICTSPITVRGIRPPLAWANRRHLKKTLYISSCATRLEARLAQAPQILNATAQRWLQGNRAPSRPTLSAPQINNFNAILAAPGPQRLLTRYRYIKYVVRQDRKLFSFSY